MNHKTRVRFAPSPTGALHIGGVRTALYNYLFAKKNGGEFILRIEDTDQKRYVEKATEYILKAFDWLGIRADEGYTIGGDFGPYKQSERLSIYKNHVDRLVSEGKAYFAFDTPEDLEKKRDAFREEKKVFSYDASTRLKMKNSLSLSEGETKELITSNKPYVIRFKILPDQNIELNDDVRGSININSNTLDDKVLFKSDGFPTYHLANIVDDHLMKISHVIRGEEWLPSLPLHYLLYEAFGWKKPHFAHLPLLLKPEGKGKLSKRDAEKGGFPIFPMEWDADGNISKGYKEEGFLPNAVVNFLALLGWNPGNEKEIFDLNELTQAFSLDRVNKSGARFDYEKAKFFNQEHLKRTNTEDILSQLISWAKSQNFEKPKTYHLQVLELMLPRATFTKDIGIEGLYFYEAPKSFGEKDLKKAIKSRTKEVFNELLKIFSDINFDKEEIKANVESFSKENEIGFGQIMQPTRLAVCGKLGGPDLFTSFEILGKDEVIRRLLSFQKKYLA